MRNRRGLLIASAAAGLIMAGAVTARAADEKKAGGDMVNCAGVNACKGQGSCAGGASGNSCAGKNDCKGRGIVELSAADCAKQGGKVVESKKR